MNYKKFYDRIINNAKIRKIDENKYYENHHIIPKCLGGTDEDDNIIKLTLKEHYICHKLLCNIYPNNKSLAHAYWMMTIMTVGAMENIKKNNLYGKDGIKLRRIKPFLEGENFYVSSRDYEWCREHWLKLSKGIKRTKKQCQNISIATKNAMKKPEIIKKCRANKNTKWYRDINTQQTFKWFPGDPDIDLTKYEWGRKPFTQEQREKISKAQLLDKTICKIGNTNYRYCWYKDYFKEIPSCFIDLKQKQSNNLKSITKIIKKSQNILKDNNIFIDEHIHLSYVKGFFIVYPSIYEICLDILETENAELIANRIIENIDLIKELNKKYIK